MTDKATILAVDDTSGSLALLAEILTPAGYQVRSADSGELALAAVAVNPPDLILLDVRMPGMDGLEVCRRLKAREETRHIPIILISAFAEVKDWVEGLQLGAADYITKPFQPAELLTRVKTHLSLSRAHVSLEQQAAALGQTNGQLRSEIAGRQRVEDDHRQSLERAERARRAMLGVLEDQKRAEEESATRARQQAVIAELGQLALTGAEFPVLLDRAAGRVAQVLDVELCKVLELAPDRSALLLRAGVGWQEGLAGCATVGIGPDSQAGFTLESREPVIVEDLRTERRFHGSGLLGDHHVVSGVSTIIGDFERPYGVLGAHTRRRRTFTVHDVHFLQGVAHVLAGAVQRGTHLAEIERMNRLYDILSQVSQTIVRCKSREELFQRICRVAVESGGFKAARISLRTDEGESVAAVARHAATPDTNLALPGLTNGCGITAEAVRTGRACLSSDAQKDQRTAGCRAPLSQAGIRSCAAFPFQFQGQVSGVLSICSAETCFFNPDEVGLLEEVALDISYALEHYDHEARRGRAEEALLGRTQELARSNAELEQFARVASHDLKEPLRMVSSYTQLLARRYRGRLDADADEYIAYAADGALRMQQLIDDLLAYARVSAREREFQTISSEAALSTALQNLAAAIQESEAVIRSGPLPPVRADPVQLGQLFQNLLGNAIKFRKSAAPHIDVACEEGPGEWRFSVSDDGIGIDPKSADRIFQVFQRLHTREEYPGTGIGLAICKKIAEQHGGRIWVTSQPGQGAAFQFTIRKHLGERG